MKSKYYFENEDEEHCYKESYFQQKMKDDELSEMIVFEAIKSKDKEYIYCKEYLTCGESSECGKQCDGYKPRNGKSGCCVHRGTMYEFGEEITLKLKSC